MKRLFLLMMILAGVMLLSGCISDGNADGELPWNAPTGWENKTLGITL